MNAVLAIDVVVVYHANQTTTILENDDVLFGGRGPDFRTSIKLEEVPVVLRWPDGWVEYGTVAVHEPEEEWQDQQEDKVARGVIYARGVCNCMVIYKEEP